MQKIFSIYISFFQYCYLAKISLKYWLLNLNGWSNYFKWLIIGDEYVKCKFAHHLNWLASKFYRLEWKIKIRDKLNRIKAYFVKIKNIIFIIKFNKEKKNIDFCLNNFKIVRNNIYQIHKLYFHHLINLKKRNLKKFLLTREFFNSRKQ